jgi:pyridoxal phosphate phosphatase PHOSPHO2
MMKELHDAGRSMEDIDQCLQQAPIHPAMVSAIKSAAAIGCELQIVSDANSYFINKILHSYGLHHYFPDKNIHTNPAFVAENGALHVLPFHAADEQLPPHGCNLCPPNMCKV